MSAGGHIMPHASWEGIVALLVVHARVEAMRDSSADGFQLWRGGLPMEVSQSGGQSYYYAQQLGNLFGIEVSPLAPEA